MLDAHDAGGARRVHELVAPNRDGDVRWPRIGRREEEHVARREFLGVHRFAHLELRAYVAREADAVLCEHVLREPAAIEPVRVAAAVAVGRAAQRERCAGERVAIVKGGPGRTSRRRISLNRATRRRCGCRSGCGPGR